LAKALRVGASVEVMMMDPNEWEKLLLAAEEYAGRISPLGS
jgi:hypothetical protein